MDQWLETSVSGKKRRRYSSQDKSSDSVEQKENAKEDDGKDYSNKSDTKLEESKDQDSSLKRIKVSETQEVEVESKPKAIEKLSKLEEKLKRISGKYHSKEPSKVYNSQIEVLT